MYWQTTISTASNTLTEVGKTDKITDYIFYYTFSSNSQWKNTQSACWTDNCIYAFKHALHYRVVLHKLQQRPE